ncbi:MAG: CDP-alcohol phosphatidyltransferase family protein [Nitrospinota bacterium]|jgi:phosphatidylglycerophosphate synthase|nr:CDP-alcohol phosphatidyltransferase family protein [Nitrospinota bacterium]MDP6482711.1 CDP-alcohol phosphatidyltransferase family protein [Nitrospinota bacterium]MDP6618048.1 CDP-alcohol phosphatidyltransferase family protein [Nitrospinota bacterium]HJM42806.1 CDP-alcohol phosphatidyltransferase family protein [Nitrospinota bacterium]
MEPLLRAIVIAPGPEKDSAPCPPLLRAGGLSILVRALLTLKRGGVSDLTVVALSERDAIHEEVRREPGLRETRVLDVSEATPEGALAGGGGREEDFLLVLADRVFSADAADDLNHARPAEGEGLILLDDNGGFSGLAFCRAARAAEVGAALAGTGDPAGRLERAIGPADRQPLKRGFIERVRSAADARRAEDRLLRGLVKETDSFMSRHINRRISLRVTRRLARTRVTPNQMTGVHSFIGLAGAVLFAQPVRWVQVLGALLFMLSSTLDGCDGEIARLKFRQSRFGGWLDIWSDNVVHVAVFGSIAVGLYRETLAERFLWLGTFACLGVVLSAGLVSWKTLRRKTGDGNFFVSVGEVEADPPAAPQKPKKDFLRDIDDYLARRDFIYILLPLAAIGKLEWFLWASAIGGNLFFLSLLVLYARARAAPEA